MAEIFYLGIDPSLRHTGLAVTDVNGKPLSFHEIKTGDLPWLESIQKLRKEFREYLTKFPKGSVIYSPEKQLSVGAGSSSLLFAVQIVILEEIALREDNKPLGFTFPLPIQIQSYAKKVMLLPIKPNSATVSTAKVKYGLKGRISIHKIDALIAAKLSRDVYNGEWSYNAPSREPQITPWEINYGCKRP